MPVRFPYLALSFSTAALAASTSWGFAQTEGKVGQYSDVVVQGSILEPEKLEVKDDQKLAELIKAPEGFTAEIFARDLVNPRMLAVSENGTLYATRRSVGDVIMLKDEDGDGKAERVETVASRPGMHGIAFDGNKVFLVTINDVHTADVKEDGTFGELKRIINDLPDAGQRTGRWRSAPTTSSIFLSEAPAMHATKAIRKMPPSCARRKMEAPARSSPADCATRSASTGSPRAVRSTASTTASTGSATRSRLRR